uniref:Auxin response factor n=1 Tax=Ananas comosus var. bracteatus TaxID=296719 RepID=A0A6V7NZK0_ANACO|nr:unnamed protein product [Ananas comosus var. bracteatus]
MGIDLNTVEEEEEEEAPAPAAPATSAAGSVCLELWHACAGPLISLPRKGSLVVYLPQGHLEHAGDGGGGGAAAAAGLIRYGVPPHVFCRVVDVKLHAEALTDEVYAQLSLVAETEEVEQRIREAGVEGDGEMEDDDTEKRSSMPHMFCKTLTASDTSTHGGFSVPRRAAEDCFPPLDYKQQRPSQELIAKDLHGTEWRFRHIYRGQPRRHLLTTGWSAFVNKKKLVSGDAVLFLRSHSGELRLGIRRAVQLKTGAPFQALHNQNSCISTLATVASAVSMKSVFHIYYNPRASPSEFIVPYWKFTKSFSHPFAIGMRFKMRYESEDAAERRYTGLITGISDVDPIRWPGSKWRCLLVRWDEDVDISRQNRVSPWEIEPTGSISGSHGLSTSSSKRAKMSLPTVNSEFPVPNGSGSTDLGNLQDSTRNTQYPYALSGSRSGVGNPVGISGFPHHCAGFGESFRFQKVLQGQELFPHHRGTLVDASTRNSGFGSSAALNRWPGQAQGYASFAQSSNPPTQASSPSSVLMFQPTNTVIPLIQTVHRQWDKGDCINERFEMGNVYTRYIAKPGLNNRDVSRNGCKLFGFSLTERIPVTDEGDSGEVNCETEFQASRPSLERNCNAERALYALCAAPL